MIHTNKLCPYCGCCYATDDKAHTLFGSPVRTCPRCDKNFFDKDYKEEFFEATPQRLTLGNILIGSLFPFGIAAIVLLFFVVNHIDHISGLLIPAVPFAIYIFLVIKLCIDRDKIYAKECADFRASKERLMVREYVILLLDHGCYVPTSFLLQYHPDLVHYTPKKSTVSPSQHNITRI